MIEEHQSQAYDIRNTFFRLLTADPFFAGFTARKTRMLPIQPNLIPFLGVYIANEDMSSDGDANAGMVRFTHNVRIAVQVIIANNDQDQAEQKIDRSFLAIMRILWTNYSLMNVLHNLNDENVGIESAIRGTRRQIFGSPVDNNETPFAELEYDVTVAFRTEWWPDITDLLNQISVRTGVKATDLPSTMLSRKQVHVEYFFAQPKERTIDNGATQTERGAAAGQTNLDREGATEGESGPAGDGQTRRDDQS